jgi:aryl-alcohol dehydrogenase-like predicted oxidoreductase
VPTKDEIKNFSLVIEQMALNLRCDKIDAIIHYCSEMGMEIEVASTLLSSNLKAKIREEAEEANLLKKTSKLPV